MIAAPRGRRTDRTMDTGLWVMMAVIITGVALALTASPGTRALPSGVVLTGWPGMAAMLAAGGSLSVLLGSYLMFREARTARLRAARMVRDGAALAASFGALEAVKSRAEAQIAQLQAVLGGMSDGVMMVDDDLRLVAWNTRYGLLNGVPQEVLRVGVALSEVIRAQARAGEFGKLDGADGIESEVKRRIASVHACTNIGVFERVRPNGQALELRRSRLPDGRYISLYTDITARKKAEAAEAEARRLAAAAVEQKAQFVAMVSHEIRVPLNAVIGCLDLLDASGLSSQQHALATTARQAGETLNGLIEDILSLSRIDAGRLDLRPVAFALLPVLEGVRDMFEAPAAARGLRLELRAADRQLYADAGRLRQVVTNLVGNAVKFSRPGRVELVAEMVAEKSAEWLRVEVRDQGPRIPAEQAARLFQPFARLDYAREAGVPGTGLGLAICDRLVQLMGGRIGLSAGPSGGNVFWFMLPPVAGPSPTEVMLTSADAMRRGSRRARTLLVEDVASNRMLTAALLRREGHSVDLAESGSEALGLVERFPYDVVFMDLNMPGIDGWETSRRIRALPGPAASVPIVAVTGDCTVLESMRLPGGDSRLVDGVLAKPIHGDELLRMLAGVVGRGPERAATAAAPAALDTRRILDLQRGLPDGAYAALAEQCFEDIRERLVQLRDMLAFGEPSRIVASAHALAGVAGSYGLAAIERRMREVIVLGRRGDIRGAREAGQDIEAELAHSVDLLRRMLEPQSA